MTGIDRLGATDRMSRATIFNGIVFLSGQTADDRGQDFRGQLNQVLAKIEGCLAEAGSDKNHMLSVQVWMKDVAKDFAMLNAIWSSWIPAGCAPARATVQCEMALPDILVEVLVTAASRDDCRAPSKATS